MTSQSSSAHPPGNALGLAGSSKAATSAGISIWTRLAHHKAPFARPWDSAVVLDAAGWTVFLAIVLVGTMFAYAIYLRGVACCGAVKASLVGVAEPVSGAAISALWLGTVFSGWDLLGGLLIIAMMVVVALRK